MKIYNDITEIFGNTPLVKINKIMDGAAANVWAKLEFYNPSATVKDRLAIAMVDAAEKSGELKAGGTIVEATSGNTGVALAMVGAARGYKVILTMPESVSKERRKLIRAYGAELILTPAAEGMKGAVARSEELAKSGAVMVRQFENAAGPIIHRQTTGEEIWRDTEGRITHFVSSMGTTGTIMGTSGFLKSKNPAIQIIGCQPEEGSQIPGIRKWPQAYLPKIYAPDNVDRIEYVSQGDAEAMTRRLAMEEGIFAGISSGGALTVALRLAEQLENAVIVSIVCDRGDRYLSTGVFPA